MNKNKILNLILDATGSSSAEFVHSWDSSMPIKWSDIDYTDDLFRAFVEDYTDCIAGLDHKEIFKNILWNGETEIELDPNETWM